MSITEIENMYIDDLRLLDDAGSQCEYLMIAGMQRTADRQIREEIHRIGGCKTAIWLKAWCDRDGVRFLSDSDSLLVKGVLSILDHMYTGKSPQEVRMHPPVFLDVISDDVIYPEIKNNGILKCYQRLAALYITQITGTA